MRVLCVATGCQAGKLTGVLCRPSCRASLCPTPALPLSGVEGEVIIQKVLGKPFTVGYNAMVDQVTDLLEAGVIDPAKVTRNGLMNACSIAGIMLTTQVRSRAQWTGWACGLGGLSFWCSCWNGWGVGSSVGDSRCVWSVGS